MTLGLRSPPPAAAAGPASAGPEHASLALFQRIFAEEFSYVWGSMRRLGVAPRDLEDVTQELFIQVYRKMDAYDPARPIRPWLFAFAVRAASDYRRLVRHRVEILGEPATTSAPISLEPAPDQRLDQQETERLVLAALETIPIERRAVLIAFELDEQPMKDIAEALAVPLFTAYSRLRQARVEFEQAVRRIEKNEGHP